MDGDSSGSWKQKVIRRGMSGFDGSAVNCKADGVHA